MADTPLDLKTVCIGPYDASIPVAFDIQYESVVLEGFALTSRGSADQVDLESEAEDLRQRLQRGITDEAGATRTLRWSETWADARVLASDRSYDLPAPDPEGYDVTAFVRHRKGVFQLEGYVSFAREEAALDVLRTVVETVRSGSGPGFCIDGGHYPGPLGSGSVSAVLRDPDVPRYAITVTITAGAHAPGAFAVERNLSPRARPREVGSAPGFEVRIVSDAVSDYEDEAMIRFTARAGYPAEPGEPHLNIAVTLSKDSTSANAPPYDVATSVAIWNTLLDSLQRRAQ
ncbi:hypothetical protein JMK10_19745 [Rhodovulum sulfidophilum]|uniref:hypothetical protein n=1 Tax=Rhodovulum sulfidophilum TaxID=35806 RepID=UPI001924E587|nr:hypothetical protein [Rhodovulum sulfidophilum]MBL3576441.1 hypothetical protein [Rhodovulum sulfidophilum]MCE8433863.1 hypothetical protein [Rhodovulum sulfidophilum]MCF4118948.1 hypothetical protein [Rhodovulum sulfidophilum]